MSEYLVKSESLTTIADAVRNKANTTASLSLEAMAIQINNLVIKTTTTINVVPDTTSSFTYDGSVKTPVWRNYDPEQLTISGQTSATNAGTYIVYFTPKADYEWSDGTVDPREVQWSITKASGSLSLSATSGTIEGKNKTMTFTVTRAGDGKISVASSNTGIATVAVSGTTVTVTSKAYGSATITVSVAEGTNHKAPSNKTYAVTVDYMYLYKNGDQKTSLTGGWYTTASAIGSVAYNSNSITVTQTANAEDFVGCSTRNKIDLTNYNTIKINITGFSQQSSSGQGHFSIANSSLTAQPVADVRIASSGTLTMDVSGITGSYYISIWGYWTPKWSATFDKVYLQ